LRGSLSRPDGLGSFPAVVALHGCAGIRPRLHQWASTLHSWGYVVLLVDSFTPRLQTNICHEGFRVDPQYARMPDAYAARAYLARQPFVDPQRIGLMGWSHGGWTTLYAVDSIYLTRLHVTPFQVAIAFYPVCILQLRQLNAPLLILIGEADDWTPASRCQEMLRQSEPLAERTANRITLRVYPGAAHGFDGLTPPLLWPYRGPAPRGGRARGSGGPAIPRPARRHEATDTVGTHRPPAPSETSLQRASPYPKNVQSLLTTSGGDQLTPQNESLLCGPARPPP
jgi:dienelactone hydrolase